MPVPEEYLIPAYIIGRQGEYRNPRLLDDIAESFEVIESSGFVDGAHITIDDSVDNDLFLAARGRHVTKGEVACALAHLRAWNVLAKSNLRFLAVFEDDVSYKGDRTSIQIERLPESGPWWLSLERRPGDYLWTHLIPFRTTVTRSWLQPRGAGAYLISRDAAILGLKVFEDAESKIGGEVDACPRASGLFNFYVQLPPPFEASLTGTSIIGPRNQKVPSLLRRMEFTLRILFTKDYPLIIKLGLLKLKVLRPIKYLFSLHFATAWLDRFRLNRTLD